MNAPPDYVPPARNPPAAEPAYAELHCLSDFSFGRGASSARELFERARQCGYRALAITDECSLAGIVRAHEAARDTGVALIVGAEIQLADGPRLVLLVESQAGYTRLCELITRGRRAAKKGHYHLSRADLADGLPGLLVLWAPRLELDAPAKPPAHSTHDHGRWLQATFGTRLWLAVELHRDGDDRAKLQRLLALAQRLGIRPVAAGDVHMHRRSRRALQDTLSAIRLRQSVAANRGQLFRNGERHLRSRAALAAIHPAALLAETLRIARRCHFSLNALQYHYPAELVPADHTPGSWLRQLVEAGLPQRWPDGTPPSVRDQIEHELQLIAELHYEPYFLTVHDIVRFARSRDILCQGRGSAANSAVCFALCITAVDPARINTLVERFISKERDEPPDIDIDFEHERREEVIQYIYRKYGRDRAALTAEVICYKARSAVRDAAKALGLPPETVNKLVFAFQHWHGDTPADERLVEAGFDPAAPLMQRVATLTAELIGHPRHLSQHVGGFVISDAPLSTLVPVENAAMAERTLIQWDKDDLDALGLLKVDCLALGMLTALRKCLALLRHHGRREMTLATIPATDPATYAMLQKADSVGVFQVESRAQMSMLPRLKPRCFYDLVIEVAIVRPGPIQGEMVHPYLQRRNGEQAVHYPSPDVRKVLERTLGIPLFQEQVMKLAIVVAGYTPGEADQLRRAMAAWKRHGNVEQHRNRIVAGMRARGYSPAFSEQLFNQLKGFGSYGFPESHAASFALLVWASAWLKCHEPAAFSCALLNSLPMGFYSASQLVQDARRHGVDIRPVDVCASDWDSTLEPLRDGPDTAQPAIRLGLRTVRGLSHSGAERIVAARREQAFGDLPDLVSRTRLDARDRAQLANANALSALAGDRHHARWAAAGIEAQRPLFGHASPAETTIDLPPPTVWDNTRADYAALGLSLGPHPLLQLRPQLRRRRCRSSRQLAALASGSHARTAGLVTLRQRPSSASGTLFVTLEDEYGNTNIIVWKRLVEQQRRILLSATLLGVDGRWESTDGVSNLVATRLHDYSALLGNLDNRSRDFH